MARTNTKTPARKERTHEGAPAAHLTKLQELERSVLACLLWEKQFYEDGEDIATRIETLTGELVKSGKGHEVRELAAKARNDYKLRHAPLWLTVALAKHRDLDQDVLNGVIQRADELAEWVALYWRDGKKPLPNQAKKGLAKAFNKFDAYQLAKYDRANAVRLRDVMFLTHPSPHDTTQVETFKQLANGTLPVPDTWETALSGGADKRETFERLLKERKLGYMALLRNLRNMREAGVDKALVNKALMEGSAHRVLPFRFVAAARTNPEWEPMIEMAMLLALDEAERLPGRTILLVDVSGSMRHNLSGHSELRAEDAASALAMLCREICDDVAVYTFSNDVAQVPLRRGFALGDAIAQSQPHMGTRMGEALEKLRKKESTADRTIVFTDEQSHDAVGRPIGKGYMVNVAAHKNGVGYGDWTRISGFSEAIVDYIRSVESA